MAPILLASLHPIYSGTVSCPDHFFLCFWWGERPGVTFNSESPGSGDCFKGSKQAVNNEINYVFLFLVPALVVACIELRSAAAGD